LLEYQDAPYKHGEALRALEIGLASSVLLMDTVFFNYDAIRNGQTTRYQRGSWTNRLPSNKRIQFERRLKEFLEESDEKARLEMASFEEKHNSPDQVTAGIGMFYFEDIPQHQAMGA
jgi:hypothetical protein